MFVKQPHKRAELRSRARSEATGQEQGAAATRASAAMHAHKQPPRSIPTHLYFRAASKLRFMERWASATATTLAPCRLRRFATFLLNAANAAGGMLDTLKEVRTAVAGGAAARVAARAAIVDARLSGRYPNACRQCCTVGRLRTAHFGDQCRLLCVLCQPVLQFSQQGALQGQHPSLVDQQKSALAASPEIRQSCVALSV